METRSEKNKGKAVCDIKSHDRSFDRDHGEDEEENMDKFFELVKNIRGTRHYVVKYDSDELKLENVEGDKRRRVEGERMQVNATWKPMFRPEDFQVNKSGSTSVSELSTFESNGGIKKDEKKRRVGLGLDLNLPP